jgi:hypothetical protein
MKDSCRFRMMQQLCRLFCALALSISATGEAVETQFGMTPPQSQRMIGGQIIVKFAAGTPAHVVYVKALAGGANSDPRLVRLAARLSTELEMPLTIDRLASGQAFIISVDVDTLMAELVGYLNARTDIRRARLLDAGRSAERLYYNPVVAVDFQPDSTMEQALARDLGARMEAAHGFATGVGKDTGIQVSAQLPQSLELVVDMSTVTTELLTRFKRRPDVEYAQLNVLLQPYGGGIVTPVP